MIKKNENITWLKIKIIWWKIWKLLKIELLNTNGSENLSQKWEGTIHILRKHCTCIEKNRFFRQNNKISFSALHFDEIFMLYFKNFITYVLRRKNAQKIRENVVVGKKKVLT
jgi:hypothetical protein